MTVAAVILLAVAVTFVALAEIRNARSIRRIADIQIKLIDIMRNMAAPENQDKE